MISSQGTLGRIFTLRLEDGDRIPQCIEQFAAEQGIKAAFCSLVGGIDNGNLVVGPEDGDAETLTPMLHTVHGAHEAVAVGAIFSNAEGRPILHMHAALGREETTKTGCIRPGLDVWTVVEVILMEILGTDMVRKHDPKIGLELLGKA